jgi:hypothetical protein
MQEEADVKRDLVIARVGPRSLHASWVDPGRPRTWDLMVLPYTPIPETPDLDCIVADVVPGPKWSGLRTLLNSWDGWRSYDRIWLPDDDLLVTQDTITAMFAVSRQVGLDLFAPALHDASYYAHFSTMRNHSFTGRWTSFIEIMMPGFSAATLERLLPTLDLTETGWGWGLDPLWAHLLEHRNMGMIDALPVLHTRPVGQLRDVELAARVRAEASRILTEHGCQEVHTTFGAFGPDLQPLELEPEAFFAALVRGWQHLIDADPRVLSWLVEFQRPLLRTPDYPVGGTPTVLPGAGLQAVATAQQIREPADR